MKIEIWVKYPIVIAISKMAAINSFSPCVPLSFSWQGIKPFPSLPCIWDGLWIRWPTDYNESNSTPVPDLTSKRTGSLHLVLLESSAFVLEAVMLWETKALKDKVPCGDEKRPRSTEVPNLWEKKSSQKPTLQSQLLEMTAYPVNNVAEPFLNSWPTKSRVK